MDNLFTKKVPLYFETDESQLIAGDSFKILTKMKPESVDMVFADPPYFLSNDGITCQGGKMVSVDQAYMVGHMKNADGSINNKNVVLSAACEAAELFQCMMSVNQKLEDWQRFNNTLEMHLRSVECEKIHDICQALYGMKHPSDELEGLYLAREDEQICLLYYQVFVGMLEINITSAEVLYKQKEEIINE